MSSARFLLEFEATGDQEVVNAIKEVGTAGKETAADLDALKNIEDPFSSLSEGADSAIGPIQEVGSAATETVAPLQDMGSATEELGGIFGEAGTSTADFSANMDAVGGAADATVGGLTDANTAVGDFGTSATTAGETTGGMGKSVTTAAGAITALGGTIGSVVGSLFRYQDIQLKLQKAQAAAARATETYRKAEAGLDALLKTATSNAAGIAAARQRLADAQARVNELMEAGVTSGAEWEAAQAELQAAQAALNKEFAKGGGDVAKLTSAMEKSENSAAKMVIATENLEKATRTANMGILDMVFGFAGLAGSIVQTTNQMKSFGTVLKALPLAAVGAALAAGTAAVGALLGATRALSFNFGGLTDVLSGVGKAFGDVLPSMQGFLTGLEDAGRSTADFFTRYTEGLASMAGITGAKVDYTKAKFGDLTEQYIKTGTTGSAVFDGIIGKTVAWAKENGVSMDEVIAKAHALDASQQATAASTEKLGGAMASTIDYTKGFNSILQGANDGLSSVGSTVIKVGGSFVELHGTLTDLGNGYSEINGQIIKNSDILNNSGLSAEKAAAAHMTLQGSVKASASAMAGATAAAQGEAGATLATITALEASEQKLADVIAVKNNATAASNQLQAALNTEMASLIEEEAKLKAASAAATNHAIQLQAVQTATQAGITSIDQWVAGLATAAAEEEAAVGRLAEYGHSFSQLPAFIEPTLSNLKSFAEAARMGGQAAVEMGQNALDAFADMTSNASSSLQGLIDVVRKGGETLKEDTKKWWDEIPAGVAKNFSAAQQEMITHLANMMAEGQNVLETFEWDLMLSSLPAAASKMEASFRDMAARTKGPMQEIWTTAADIAATGSDDMIKAMNKAFESGAVGQPLIDQLKTILTGQMPGVGTEAGAAVGKGLDPAAAAAGQSAALTLSQEFATAGTHIASVMKGIQANMKIVPPPMDIDIAPAAKKLQSLVATMRQHKTVLCTCF